jgi:hypothetical protein
LLSDDLEKRKDKIWCCLTFLNLKNGWFGGVAPACTAGSTTKLQTSQTSRTLNFQA